MITKKAVIEWIREEKGGRTKPPLGTGSPSYATEIRYVDGERWPDPVGWSLVVAKIERLSTDFNWIADVHFLVEEAPHESLRDRRDFELYEGGKCVARGRVLAKNEVPGEIVES